MNPKITKHTHEVDDKKQEYYILDQWSNSMSTCIEQIEFVLSRFTDEAVRGERGAMAVKWAETGFNPAVAGEWISLGVWNPLVAAFLWDSSMSPSHILEDRVPPTLVESVCRGESPAEDIVKLFFGGRLETEFVGITSYSHAEKIALVLGRFTDEALHGRREDMLRRWIDTRFDPILVGAWMSAGVWSPESADELWGQGVSPAHIFNHRISRDLIEAVCGGQRGAWEITETVANR